MAARENLPMGMGAGSGQKMSSLPAKKLVKPTVTGAVMPPTAVIKPKPSMSLNLYFPF